MSDSSSRPPVFVTINGVAVNAAYAIDALLAQVAELSLALITERARNRHLSEVLTTVMADPPGPPPQPADGPLDPSEPAWGVSSGL